MQLSYTGFIVVAMRGHLASFRHHHYHLLLLLLLVTYSVEVLASSPGDLLCHDRTSKYDQLALVALATSVRAVRLVALQRHAHAVVAAARAARVAAAAGRRRRRRRGVRRQARWCGGKRRRIRRPSQRRRTVGLSTVTSTHHATITGTTSPSLTQRHMHITPTLTFDLDLPKFNHFVPCAQWYDWWSLATIGLELAPGTGIFFTNTHTHSIIIMVGEVTWTQQLLHEGPTVA